MVGLGSLLRHGLEADRVPSLGRGTKVAEMWTMGAEFRELDIWWEKTWIPTIRRNIKFLLYCSGKNLMRL